MSAMPFSLPGFLKDVPAPLDTDTRLTPPALFVPLMREFDFTLDVAADATNTKCPRFFTVEDDALRRRWGEERVWCNPPWSQTPAWVEKAWAECLAGTSLIAMLLPDNRTHQKWWQTLVEPFREATLDAVQLRVRFLPRRWHFGTPDDPHATRKARPQHGCALLVWRRLANTEALSRAVQLEFPEPR